MPYPKALSFLKTVTSLSTSCSTAVERDCKWAVIRVTPGALGSLKHVIPQRPIRHSDCLPQRKSVPDLALWDSFIREVVHR